MSIIDDKKPKQQIKEIQGLRGISITSVLLFHLKPDLFVAGYLGVDVFFAISGYLMCSILTRHSPLNMEKVCTFYFRRFKRIMPIYLFVILSTLLFATCLLLHPIDYSDLFDESIKPLLFYSNHPDSRTLDYFDQELNEFRYFRHLWSLSVEMQFYLIVPVLFLVLNMFSSKLKITIILLLTSASFYYQLIAIGNSKHMDLLSRTWQFMFGFLAYELQQVFGKTYKIFTLVAFPFKVLLPYLLVLTMFIQIISTNQFNRLIALILTLLILTYPDKHHLLSYWLLVKLGDVSYSVYLVHWPLIQFCDYSNHFNKSSYSVTSGLFVISILLGYLIETEYKRLATNYLNSWSNLFLAISTLYLLIGYQLYTLKFHDYGFENLLKRRTEVEIKDPLTVVEDAVKMWNGTFTKKLSQHKSIIYNHQFQQVILDLSYCSNKNKTDIPTRFDLEKEVGFRLRTDLNGGIFWNCVNKGNGTKNIVIIGNSHARGAHFGVEHYFRDIYANLTIIAAGACMTVPWIDFFAKGDIMRGGAGCRSYVNHLQEILEKWNHPIDILIVINLYYPPPVIKTTPFKNPETDKFFQVTQHFYNNLSKIARDVVFFPDYQFILPTKEPVKYILRRIYENKPLDEFRFPVTKQFIYGSNTKSRIRAIKCPKCVRLDWAKIWCDTNEEANETCVVADFDRRIGYFMDRNHVNIYGSLKLAKFIRNEYDKFIKQIN